MITFLKKFRLKSLVIAFSLFALLLFSLEVSAEEAKAPHQEVAFAVVSKESDATEAQEQEIVARTSDQEVEDAKNVPLAACQPSTCSPCCPPAYSCSNCCKNECCCFCVPYWFVEPKLYAFWPQDSLLRDIYDDVWVDYQLQLGYRFTSCFSAAVMGNYMYNSGNSKGLHESTKIYIPSASLALRYHFFLSDCFDFYLGAGPRYYWIRCKNRQAGSTKTDKSERLGAFAELGFLFHLSQSFFIDLSAGYSYGRLHFTTGEKYVKGNTLKVGGLHAGVGLGFKF